MPNFDLARHNMVESQIRTNKVTEPRVIEALRTVPRHLFVPASKQSLAYIDEPLPIDTNRFLPSPMVAARLYQLAEVEPTDLVLVVGAASGYGAAVLGRLASAVVALEENPELAAMARNALEAANGEHVMGENVIVAEGPLPAGWRKQAPYDAIVLEGAAEAIPDELLDQLAPEGRLVAVVREAGRPGRATLMRRTGNIIGASAAFDAMLPLLPGFERAREFAF